MELTFKISGHHIYTIQHLFPFFYRFRIGLGKWRYRFTERHAQGWCDYTVTHIRCSLLKRREEDATETGPVQEG